MVNTNCKLQIPNCKFRRRGQTTTEFLMMLVMLTGVGIFILQYFVGTPAAPGAINAVTASSAQQIGLDN